MAAATARPHSSPYSAMRSGGAAWKPASQASAKAIASGVRIVAGSMTTTSTPHGRISQRSVSEKASSACLDALYAAFDGSGKKPSTEVTLSTRPRARLSSGRSS